MRIPSLQNQHAVTVESANDRPARTRTEAAAGDAGLPLQNVPETAVQLPDQVERVQRRHRIECLERRLGAARRCGDGYVLVHGRQAELEVDRGGPARRQGDHLPARGQMLPLGEHLVAARRNIADLEAAVLRSQADKPRTHDQDHRSVNRAAVLRQLSPCRARRRYPVPAPARPALRVRPAERPHIHCSLNVDASVSLSRTPCPGVMVSRSREPPDATACARTGGIHPPARASRTATTRYGTAGTCAGKLRGRSAGGNLRASVRSCPPGGGWLYEPFRHIGRPDLGRPYQAGYCVVPQLADGAVLVCVVPLVPDGRD